MYSYENANQALIGLSKELLTDGKWRVVRGQRCLEIDHPVIIEITNPTDRYINIPERKWNKYLPFVESLWMALGLNDLDVLPGNYVKNLYNYSDDGHTWRGGYGPRIRAFSGVTTDYKISNPKYRNIVFGHTGTVDQLKFVVESLKRDIHTRQAIITIGDPAKDCFNDDGTLIVTKDYPCSRTLQFMEVNGALNLTLYIRSNDIVYGLSGVNIFNFTWMLEYVANMMGLPVGKYYHIANNLHAYAEFIGQVEELARHDINEYTSKFNYQYPDKIQSLADFDDELNYLLRYEQEVRFGYRVDHPACRYKMTYDWGLVFLAKVMTKEAAAKLNFINPHLSYLFS